MRLSLPVKSPSLAPGMRYWENAELSALKPVVSMLAMLLAMTSIWWLSDICRDKPTRSAFCIGNSPLLQGRTPFPGRRPAVHPPSSPKPAGERFAAGAVPALNIIFYQILKWFGGGFARGKKGRSAKLTRQNFPSMRNSASIR